MIARVSGVILDGTDLDNVASAFELLARLMAEHRDEHGNPTPMPASARLEAMAAKLARAARNASPASAEQDEPDEPPAPASGGRAQTPTDVQHFGHATIGATAAATRLGITANGARDLARRGRIPAHHNGTRWVFDATAVDAFAAQRSPG